MLRHAHFYMKGGKQTFAAGAKSRDERKVSGRSGLRPSFSDLQTQRKAAGSPLC